VDLQQQRRTLWSTLMGIFVVAWPSVILVAALPTIAADLGTDASTLSWVITLPLLVSSVLLPTFGRLGDLFGHRKVFLWGLGLSIITAALTVVAWDAWSLIVFRTLSQTAGVATTPTAIALIMAAFAPKDRPKALGAWSGVTAFSPALGLMFGGLLVAALGWRGVFVMQVLLAAAFFPFCVRWLRETPLAEKVGFDVVGGISLMIASGSVLYFFDRAAAWGWDHPSIWVAALIFPIAVVSFVRAEGRTSDPLLPPGLFRSRRFAAPVSAEVLSICAGNGAFFIAPLLLTSMFDTNVVSTSFLMLPLPLGMAVGSPVGGRVAVRIGERAGATIGAVAMTAAMGLFLVGFLMESLPVFVVGLVIMGLAHGMMRPATASAAGNALQPEFFGVGMATMRMTSQLGGAAGISIAVTATALGGYGWFYAIGIGIAALSIVAVRFVLSQRPPTSRAEQIEATERVETDTALTISPAFEG